MLKGNGDKRLNEQHSISQDSGCEIDNILKKNLNIYLIRTRTLIGQLAAIYKQWQERH